MRILGIETSCDETAAAIVEDGTKILSNVIASSLDLHAKTGGIIPENAAREQLKCIVPVIDEAIKSATSNKAQVTSKSDEQKNHHVNLSPVTCHLSPPDIDAIAITYGPGLIGSLLVGVEAARTLAYVWKKPIIPVNHLVGHIYANWLETDKSEKSDTQILRSSDNQIVRNSDSPSYPAIALLVSGGHTDLVLMKDHGKMEWIGGTRDDAAGECFDKAARALGLPYPGGPSISAEAEKFQSTNSKSQIKLPRPMINDKNLDFSFSGLKTAVINMVREKGTNLNVEEMAYEIQEAITDVLVYKTIKAAEEYKVKTILLAGGVSANKRLKEKMQEAISNTPYDLRIPIPKLCTDNAAYIASCAFFNYQPVDWQKIITNSSLSIED